MNALIVDRRGIRQSIGAVVIGGAAFAAGFFGPIALVPDSNQGPLFGICMTGPLGVVLGVLVGTYAADRGLTARRFGILTCAVAALAVVVTLLMSLPPDHYEGYVVDAEVVGCDTANELGTPLLTVRVRDAWTISEKRKPWNRGVLVARRDLRNARTQYLPPRNSTSCAEHPPGSRGLYTIAQSGFNIGGHNTQILDAVPPAWRTLLNR